MDTIENKTINEKSGKEQCNTCGSCARGNTALMIGAIFAFIGVLYWVVQGYVCVSCLISAPLFLGIGVMQRLQYMKRMKDDGGSCPVELG